MTLPKAVLIAVLALAAMSTAGYGAAILALQGADGDTPSPADDTRVSVIGSSLLGANRDQQSRALAAVSPTPTPTATATPEPSPTNTPVPPTASPTETPPPPTATPIPPTATLIPPTSTPVPPTPTPVPPTATPLPPTPTPLPPTPTPLSEGFLLGTITRYADNLTGSSLGCNGYGAYDPDDATIIAVGPDHWDEWACGQMLGVCGVDPTTGAVIGCIVGQRQDSCPGCPANDLDLSTAAFEIVCGPTNSRCTAIITPLP